LIYLKRAVMEVIFQQEGDPEPDARFETVIKAVVINDGVEACTVGFLPGHVACRPQEAAFLHQKFAQILMLMIPRTACGENHGMASYRHLDDIPEGH
jgi:hypothetical protein